jgi:hypothetical protein
MVQAVVEAMQSKGETNAWGLANVILSLSYVFLSLRILSRPLNLFSKYLQHSNVHIIKLEKILISLKVQESHFT